MKRNKFFGEFWFQTPRLSCIHNDPEGIVDAVDTEDGHPLPADPEAEIPHGLMISC